MAITGGTFTFCSFFQVGEHLLNGTPAKRTRICVYVYDFLFGILSDTEIYFHRLKHAGWFTYNTRFSIRIGIYSFPSSYFKLGKGVRLAKRGRFTEVELFY